MLKQLTQRAVLAEAEIQRGETDDTLKLIWSTGFKGLRSEWGESFYEELEMSDQAIDLSRLNKGAPFLAQHNATVNSVIGVVERAWLESGLGYAVVKLSKRDDVKGIVQDVKDGILRNVSVGYSVSVYTDVTQKGDSTKTYRATKWLPKEISIVAIGFDPLAQTIRSENQLNDVEIINQSTQPELKQGEQMDKKELETSETKTEVREESTAPQIDKIDIEAIKAEAIKSEKQRTSEITNAVKAAGLSTEFATELIERNLQMSEASKEIFKKLEANNQPQKENGSSQKEIQMTKRELAELALLNRVDAKRFKVEASNPYKQARFIDLIETVVDRQAGESDSQFVKRALVTAGLAELLSSVSNKVMGQQGSDKFTYSKWTAPITLRDFKETPIVQLSNYSLQAKTEGGDYAEASMSDSDEKITLRERGVRFSISQKAIINDDLGALKALPMKAQASGHRDIEATVYGILNANPTMSDTKALFHADHGNLIASVGGVPSVASMEAVNLLFAAQVGLGGEPLDLRAKYLIVPTAYEVEARQVASATMIPNAVNAVNPYAGELEVIVSSRITGSVWYAAANKEELAAIVTATLEGQDEPIVSTETNFRSSNLEMKVEFPNAAAAANYKAIVKVVV